jgi:hypothetical protein
MKKLIAIIFLINISTFSQNLLLNEIMSNNSSILQDEDGDYTDWIEIYNPSDSVINLEGFSLTDDIANEKKWIFPSIEIYPNNFLVVFASAKNKFNTELHTNFKLNQDGEELYLYDNFGFVVDNFIIPKLKNNISIGRGEQEPASWLFYNFPTPGFSNSTQGFNSTTYPPIFSVPSGFYTNFISLEIIKPNDSAQVFFTLDGSEPNEFSNEYINAVIIDTSMVIRAKCYSSENIPSETVTATYFINENSQLPVISLSTDPGNFWNDEYGIYVKGTNGALGDCGDTANYNQDWERPINIEFFENNQSIFNINAGVKIHGGCTRRLPQKALSIIARSSYGFNNIPYSIFPNLPFNDYSSILLRNSGNDNGSTYFRDAFLQILLENHDIEIQAYRPATVFLNGKYFGLFNIREVENADYLVQHKNLPDKNIDLLYNENTVKQGSSENYDNLISFINNNNLSDTNNYNYVNTQMDIDNYIIYMLTEMYAANRDWFPGNTKFWREQTDNSKWRWFLNDLDYSYGLFEIETVSMNMIDFVRDPNKYPSIIINGLLQNDNFKNKFINSYSDLINSIFRPEYVINKIDSIQNIIKEEIPREIQKWKNINSYETWLENVEELRFFANNRLQYMTQNFIDEFNLEQPVPIFLSINDVQGGIIKINSLNIFDENWTGEYFANIPIQLSAVPRAGYMFAGWIGDTVSFDNNIQYTLKDTNKITANFIKVNSPQIIINEINYNSKADHDSDDWIELYNNSDSLINLSNWIFKDEDDLHKFTLPQNTYLNSKNYLVLCNDSIKFKNYYPEITHYLGNIGFGFSGNGELLRLFDNFGNLIDFVEYDDKLPWPIQPDGNGPTLELINPKLDNNVGNHWSYMNNLFGSPGKKNNVYSENYILISSDSLLIPSIYSTQKISIETTEEWYASKPDNWIEIKPANGFGNDTIELKFLENPNNLPRENYISFSNSYKSSTLKIIQNSSVYYTVNVLIDSSDAGSISGAGNYKENSIVTLTAIPNQGWQFTNWSENDSILSLDSIYTFAIDNNKLFHANFNRISTTEIEKNDIPQTFYLFPNYPNPFNPTTTIRYSIPQFNAEINSKQQKTILKVFDILGREIATLVNQKQSPGNYEVIFDAKELPSGIYFYKLTSANLIQLKKMILIK